MTDHRVLYESVSAACAPVSPAVSALLPPVAVLQQDGKL